MIRIEGIRRRFTERESDLLTLVAGVLNLPPKNLNSFKISKKALDARKEDRISFVYSVDFETSGSDDLFKISLPNGWHIKSIEPFVYQIQKKTGSVLSRRPVIIGSGPCGLFAGLILAEAGMTPLLLERGKPVEERVHDVRRLMEHGRLNPDSNIQFGEGGAGTFSDGKLYTLINDPRIQYLFDQLIEAGAPPEIAWDAKPHIGTDKLTGVVQKLREKIMGLGGEIRYQAKLTGLEIENTKIKSIRINENEEIPVDILILAIGHSARDTLELLADSGLHMEAKVFSMGVRIEHLQEWIQKSQYGNFCHDVRLPAARYKLAVNIPGDRGAYTFCMCPGGTVVPAASEAGGVVTNGMSTYSRDGVNANSALMVNITPDDYGNHPLGGIAFQRQWEQIAYQAGGGDFTAPVQLLGDFLNNQISSKFRQVFPSYQPDTEFADLSTCLPDFVVRNLKTAIPLMNNKLKGYSHPNAVLTGIETRSSSPVRILRDDSLQSNIRGIYPAGEGAGYAGGIVSSAVDGLLIAEQLLSGRIKD